MNKLALITGATSGIGRATSVMLAALSYNLIMPTAQANAFYNHRKG